MVRRVWAGWAPPVCGPAEGLGLLVRLAQQRRRVHELLGDAAHVDAGAAQAPLGPRGRRFHEVQHRHLCGGGEGRARRGDGAKGRDTEAPEREGEGDPMRRTLAPSLAASLDAARPPEPPPMTTRSYSNPCASGPTPAGALAAREGRRSCGWMDG